jgi:putative sterol carrier protein
MENEGYLFLSKDWIGKAVAAIERAKATDESVRKQASEFSLSIAYVIENIPEALKELYSSDRVIVYIELDKGELKRFKVDTGVKEKTDFTVISDYEIAKKNFTGELNPVSTFIRRQIKIEPMRKVYADPSFSAKALTTVNTLLKIIKEVPTVFPE